MFPAHMCLLSRLPFELLFLGDSRVSSGMCFHNTVGEGQGRVKLESSSIKFDC